MGGCGWVGEACNRKNDFQTCVNLNCPITLLPVYSSVTVEPCSSADGPCRPFRLSAIAMVYQHVRVYAWLSWPEIVRKWPGTGHADLMTEGANTMTFIDDNGEDKQ